MKKHYFSIFLTIFLGLHLSSVDILAQSCTQLSLPDNAIARLCRQEGGTAGDLDFSPDGKNENGETVASGVYFCTLTTREFSATRKMLILK